MLFLKLKTRASLVSHKVGHHMDVPSKIPDYNLIWWENKVNILLTSVRGVIQS